MLLFCDSIPLYLICNMYLLPKESLIAVDCEFKKVRRDGVCKALPSVALVNFCYYLQNGGSMTSELAEKGHSLVVSKLPRNPPSCLEKNGWGYY